MIRLSCEPSARSSRLVKPSELLDEILDVEPGHIARAQRRNLGFDHRAKSRSYSDRWSCIDRTWPLDSLI